MYSLLIAIKAFIFNFILGLTSEKSLVAKDADS